MRVSLVLFIGALTAGKHTLAAEYSLIPFNIGGSSQVVVRAISDRGIATGSYVPLGQSVSVGFVGMQGAAMTLPPVAHNQVYSATPYPTAINDEGTITGTYSYGDNYVFVWHRSRYVASISLGQGLSPGVFLPSISGNGQLSYNVSEGGGLSFPFSGTLRSQVQLRLGGFPTVASSNHLWESAGEYTTFVGSQEAVAVFLLSPLKVQSLLPPGASSSYGGWINERGDVGGSYQESTNLKGFVYSNGAYRTFAMPTAPVTLTTQGIDCRGAVVGVYADDRSQYAFISFQNKVVRLGAFPTTDNVHVSISNFGKEIAIADTNSSGVSRSYVADRDPANH